MRTLKFRAYDAQIKTMLNDVVYMNTGHGYGNYSVVLPFTSENYYKAHGQQGWRIDDAGNAYKHNLAVMQFTGLKDRHGTEIFEGDIVDLGYMKCEVRYFTNLSWDSGGSLHPGFYFAGVNPDEGDLSYHDGFDDVEVIGNIYENPELLADTKVSDLELKDD